MLNLSSSLGESSVRNELTENNTTDCNHSSYIGLENNFSVFIPNQKLIQYCYTCRGKIRKYEIKPPPNAFSPNNFSTPLTKSSDISNKSETLHKIRTDQNLNELRNIKTDSSHIPTISRQVSVQRKYSSYEIPNEANERKHKKSLKCIWCVTNVKLNDKSIKRRTQIQACSISLMVIAILTISFVLVNITTPNNASMGRNKLSTNAVPTLNNTSDNQTENSLPTQDVTNETTDVSEDAPTFSETFTSSYSYTTELVPRENVDESILSDTILKIRKNIRTYTKNEYSHLKKEILDDTMNTVSSKYCSCQLNEVCMLDESTGVPVCQPSIDPEDPTGCGGLCALETEACQLVDRARRVYMCRLLTTISCTPEQWRCRNGLCVSASSRCDGVIQCYDRSDETDCECDLTKAFRCGHLLSCFDNEKLCNGVVDCWDGYDELNCTSECEKEQFTCNDGQCVLGARFCDGLADCADGSDEPRGCSGECGRHELQCGNRRCVSLAARCDTRDDCGDNTDELHCDATASLTQAMNTTDDQAVVSRSPLLKI